MASAHRVRRTVTAGLLCSALAGCGSVVASGPGAAPAASSSPPATSVPGTTPEPAPPAVGCAAVDQATSVSVHRVMHLVEPTRAGALTVTRRNPALVRALFGQFCAAVSHPDTAAGAEHCPADFGISYTGTFYAGTRILARFAYAASGCQSVSLTAGGKTQSTMVFGKAYAAAPDLRADMAAVLGVPASSLAPPASQVNPGGPDKPLRQVA